MKNKPLDEKNETLKKTSFEVERFPRMGAELLFWRVMGQYCIGYYKMHDTLPSNDIHLRRTEYVFQCY